MIFGLAGELAALAAAFLWAGASVAFRRIGLRIPPVQLNLLKNLFAIVLILGTMVISGGGAVRFDFRVFGLLFLSGVIGIGLGDTAFLACLNRLGERRTVLMVETLAPPMAVVLAVLFLAEHLSITALCGIALTLFGVAWVISERGNSGDSSAFYDYSGVIWGLIAAGSQGFGAVLSRIAFVESDMTALLSTFIRLCGGIVGPAIWILIIRPQPMKTVFRSPRTLAAVGAVTFFAAYLGIWLQQISLKFIEAGVAQTLLSTSSLFVIPYAVYAGERVGWRAVAGALIAVAGIAVIFYLR